jgi:hypothetical protein
VWAKVRFDDRIAVIDVDTARVVHWIDCKQQRKISGGSDHNAVLSTYRVFFVVCHHFIVLLFLIWFCVLWSSGSF